ncbi:MAG: DUF2304 domain-containing protein [Solobacterium sp.]|nr:DUF2304 domain-containing protein [Solobacterium sp.]
MSNAIRILLAFGGLLGFIFMIRNIQRAKLVISDSIFWFLFSLILFIIAIFPQISFALARALGVMSASNLVYLILIALLILRVFQLDVKLSQTNTKLQRLTQGEAIHRADHEKNASLKDAEKTH